MAMNYYPFLPILLVLSCDTRFIIGTQLEPGGFQNSKNDHPWLVQLRTSLNSSSKVECQGTVISNEKVVTAAHCLHDDKGKLRDLRQLNIRLNQTTLNISSVAVHPRFDFHRKVHDLAVVFLSTNPEMQIAPLLSPNEHSTSREGFVITHSHSEPSDNHLSVHILPPEDCKFYLNRKNPTVICATSSPGNVLCHGDSGSPLMCRDSQNLTTWFCGLVSYGKENCSDGTDFDLTPVVYTNLTSYIEWVNSVQCSSTEDNSDKVDFPVNVILEIVIVILLLSLAFVFYIGFRTQGINLGPG